MELLSRQAHCLIPNVLFTDIKMSVMTRANGLFSGSWRVSDGYVLYLVLFVPDIGKGGERERERQAGRQAGRDRQTEREREGERQRQRETQTDRQRQTGRQTDRQADRQTETDRERERERGKKSSPSFPNIDQS